MELKYNRSGVIAAIEELTHYYNVRPQSIIVVGASADVLRGTRSQSNCVYLETPLWMYRRLFPTGMSSLEKELVLNVKDTEIRFYIRIGSRLYKTTVIDDRMISVTDQFKIYASVFALKPYGFNVSSRRRFAIESTLETPRKFHILRSLFQKNVSLPKVERISLIEYLDKWIRFKFR